MTATGRVASMVSPRSAAGTVMVSRISRNSCRSPARAVLTVPLPPQSHMVASSSWALLGRPQDLCHRHGPARRSAQRGRGDAEPGPILGHGPAGDCVAADAEAVRELIV